MHKLNRAIVIFVLGLSVTFASCDRFAMAQVREPDGSKGYEVLEAFMQYFLSELGISDPEESRRADEARLVFGPLLERGKPEDPRRARARLTSEIWAAFRQAWNGVNENNEAHYNRGLKRLNELLKQAPENSGNEFLAENLLSLLPRTFSNGLVFLTDDGMPIADPDAFVRSQLRRLIGLSESDGGE